MDPPHVHAIVPDHHSTRLDLRRAPASTAISDAVPLLPFAMDRLRTLHGQHVGSTLFCRACCPRSQDTNRANGVPG